MTGAVAGARAVEDCGVAGRMRETADLLRAAGLRVRLCRGRGGWDITAVAGRPGGRETEVVIDEDGYAEIRFWNPPGATPAEVTNVITGALAVVHGVPGGAR
jgi:hypothetical protein